MKNKAYGQFLVAIVLVMLSMLSTSCGEEIACYNSTYKMVGVDSINQNITKIKYGGLDGHEIGDTVYSNFVIDKWSNDHKISENVSCRWVITKIIDDGTK